MVFDSVEYFLPLIETNPMKRYACAFCNGTGEKEFPEETTVCPVCEGKGSRLMDSDNYITCRNCNGKGCQTNDLYTTCEYCGGYGIASKLLYDTWDILDKSKTQRRESDISMNEWLSPSLPPYFA